MLRLISYTFLGGTALLQNVYGIPLDAYDVKPFKFNLASRDPRMLQLAKDTQLPASEEYPRVESGFGISLAKLKSLRNEWTTTFDWKKEEEAMNKFKHYTVTIEGLSMHFIHENSGNPDAIPLILNHGWPGSFLEFIPVISTLVHPTNKTTRPFDVIIPSLPGFAFSQAPPANWSISDTARILTTLMTSVLKYKTYAPGAKQATATLSNRPRSPNTIGLALQDSPIGQFAWIGEKLIDWSDPRQGTSPSLLTSTEILRIVSLSYLTQSFTSSVYMYAQNSGGFRTTYPKPPTDAPMLFSNFKWNNGFWPKPLIEQIGNLVQIFYHDFGGHFPGIDNPPTLASDLRAIGRYFK